MKYGTWRQISFAMGFVIILIASGCNRHGGGWHSTEADTERLTHFISGELQLESEQEKELGEIMDRLIGFSVERGQVARLHNEFHDQLSKETFDALKLKEEVSRTMDALERETLALVDETAKFHDTLNTDQREKLNRLMRKYDGRRTR